VLLSTAFEAYNTRIQVQQNEDMRKISAWVAIAAVGTLVAGIYGMNFDHMPELGWRYGYPYALGLMVSLSTFLYWRFKKAGWL
jgi:magnesium transporter